MEPLSSLRIHQLLCATKNRVKLGNRVAWRIT
jgi:hypothetical protein